MKKIIITIAFAFICQVSFSQGVNEINKEFTKYDLYKWFDLMNFKPKNLESKTFQDFLLKMDQPILDQWRVMSSVTYENMRIKNDDSMMYTFKKQLTEYYGPIPQTQLDRWFVAYFVFLEIDKWAESYIRNQQGNKN